MGAFRWPAAKSPIDFLKTVKAVTIIGCLCLALLQISTLDMTATSCQESASNASREASSHESTAIPMSVVSDLATQALSDLNFLARPRFSIDEENRIFVYDDSPKPRGVILADDDPFATPLDALIRVKVFRRDFQKNVPAEHFWIQPLAFIERQIDVCVDDLSTAGRPNTSSAKVQCRNVEDGFADLARAVRNFAEHNELKKAPIALSRDPVDGYRVIVKIDPPKARVRVMTLLEYKKYQYLQVSRDKYQWNDLLASDNDLIGWYHYRAEWPAELSGPEEGDFEITRASTITFRPNHK